MYKGVTNFLSFCQFEIIFGSGKHQNVLGAREGRMTDGPGQSESGIMKTTKGINTIYRYRIRYKQVHDTRIQYLLLLSQCKFHTRKIE